MYLHQLTFRENEGKKIEWLIDKVSLGKINLMVGKNSSGKTRTLNALTDLVNMICGRGGPSGVHGRYHVVFRDGNDELVYQVEYDRHTISSENLHLNDELLLERGEGGKGRIKYMATPGQIFLDFEIPFDRLAANAKRDRLQHPFIEQMHTWASSLRRFDFSGDLGKNSYAMKAVFDEKEVDLSTTRSSLVPLLYVAMETISAFRETVISDMRAIGYQIEDIGIMHYSERYGNSDSDRYAVYTTETGLEKQVSQHDMSQGMFRAFSVLVHMNYHIAKGEKGCMIIDDIGEGLDFTRARQLVNLLVEKAEKAGLQLIMSTNDSFIMNAVDIKHWAIIQRDGNKISLFNYENSKEIFEEFKFTGLNNFDFYASEFFKSGFSGDDE
ncbi:MAG: AAA family ATPase [Bacteroidota bacterium]